MSTWKNVASIEDFKNKDRLLVSLGEKCAVIFKVESRYFAIEDSCPHRGAPLIDGQISQRTITCPWHLAEIDLDTGTALKGPLPRGVSVYPVRELDGKIQIQI